MDMKKIGKLLTRNTSRVISLCLFLGICSVSFAGEGNDKPIIQSVVTWSTPDIPAQYKKGMYVILTGTGGPWSVKGEGGASVAVTIDGQVLQFDMGERSLEHLTEAGINPASIDYLFFTHLHGDHITEYPQYNFDYSYRTDVKIFGPPGTQAMANASADFFSVHFKEYQDVGLAPNKNTSIEEIVSGGIILENTTFKVTAAPTSHHRRGNQNHKSFAYRVDSQYGSVVISGDTAPSLNVVELASSADLLIHEAMSLERYMFHEQSPELKLFFEKYYIVDRLEDGLRSTPPKMGHTSSLELGKIAQQAKVKKLVAYHLPAFPVTSSDKEFVMSTMGEWSGIYSIESRSEIVMAVKQHYKGPFIMGEPLMVFEINNPGEK